MVYVCTYTPRERESFTWKCPPPLSPHSTHVSVIYVFYLVVPSEWSAQAQGSSCVLRQHRTKSQHIPSPPPFIRTPRRGRQGKPQNSSPEVSHPAYYSVLQRITAYYSVLQPSLPHPLRSELRRLG